MHIVLGRVLQRQTDFVAPADTAMSSDVDELDPDDETEQDVAKVLEKDAAEEQVITPMHNMNTSTEPMFVIDIEDYKQNSEKYFRAPEKKES